MTLDSGQKDFLLRLARSSIETALGSGKGEVAASGSASPEWALVPSGAFVTLKKSGDLRGCIGCMSAQDSLFGTILRMARAAALEDPRFEPLEISELPKVKIEISVLTPMVEIDDVAEIEVGRHGIYVSSGYRSGVFLPQVPTEWGWDRDAYVHQVLRKAGLPDSALQDPQTRFSVFEAIVFGEED